MKKEILLLIIPCLLFTLIGCDSGGSSGNSSPSVNVTGRYSGTIAIGTDVSSISFVMNQDGANVSAQDSDGDRWVGSVSGNTLELATSSTEGSDVASADISGPVEDTTVVLTGTGEGTIGGIDFNVPVTINLTRTTPAEPQPSSVE